MKYTGQPAPIDAWMADPDRPPFEPVVDYRIPQSAQPPAVAKAEANYVRLASEFADCRSQIAEAKELRQHEIGKAHEASTTARVEGTKPPAKKPDQVAAEWDEKLNALRAELHVLAEAVHQAGNTMIDAVREHRQEWLERLDQLDAEATTRLSEALEAAEAALAELIPARSAPAWLEGGISTQYVGSNPEPGSHSGELNAAWKYVVPEKVLVRYEGGKGVFEEKVAGRPKKQVGA